MKSKWEKLNGATIFIATRASAPTKRKRFRISRTDALGTNAEWNPIWIILTRFSVMVDVR